MLKELKNQLVKNQFVPPISRGFPSPPGNAIHYYSTPNNTIIIVHKGDSNCFQTYIHHTKILLFSDTPIIYIATCDIAIDTADTNTPILLYTPTYTLITYRDEHTHTHTGQNTPFTSSPLPSHTLLPIKQPKTIFDLVFQPTFLSFSLFLSVSLCLSQTKIPPPTTRLRPDILHTKSI